MITKRALAGIVISLLILEIVLILGQRQYFALMSSGQDWFLPFSMRKQIRSVIPLVVAILVVTRQRLERGVAFFAVALCGIITVLVWFEVLSVTFQRWRLH